MKKLVRIANATPGSAGHTNERRARRLCRQGRATFLDNGELYFFTPAQVIQKRELENVDAEIQKHRGGKVFWNGSDIEDEHGVTMSHRPGEVRC